MVYRLFASVFFFLMIRRPPRSTQSRSSAASDVYKRQVIKSAWAVIGVLLYAISAVFWLVVLSRVNLSVAYPIVAVGYVVVVLYSWLVFKEPVKWFTWIGLAFIVMGVVIAAQGLKSKTPNESSNLKAPTAKVAAASGDVSVKNETGIGNTCILYTSDAADDLLCVDLGGRRNIKKKKP